MTRSGKSSSLSSNIGVRLPPVSPSPFSFFTASSFLAFGGRPFFPEEGLLVGVTFSPGVFFCLDLGRPLGFFCVGGLFSTGFSSSTGGFSADFELGADCSELTTDSESLVFRDPALAFDERLFFLGRTGSVFIAGMTISESLSLTGPAADDSESLILGEVSESSEESLLVEDFSSVVSILGTAALRESASTDKRSSWSAHTNLPSPMSKILFSMWLLQKELGHSEHSFVTPFPHTSQ